MGTDYSYGGQTQPQYLADPSGQLGMLPNPAYNPGGMSPYISSNESLGLPPANTGYSSPSTPYIPFDPTTNPDYLARAGQYGYGTALQNAMIQGAPAQIQLQGQTQGYDLGITAALANQQFQTGVLNQNYGTDTAHLANRVASNQVDIAANQRQPGYLTTLHNIAGQQYDLTRQGEAANADQNRRALEAQLTGQGAFTSVGGQQGRYDIATNLVRQTQGTNLQQQGETANYFENMAKVGDTGQKLDIMARDFGVSGDELKNHLQQGLDRLGLDTGNTISDLFTRINSNNLQEAAQAQAIVNSAVQASDYYARLYPGYQGPGRTSIPQAQLGPRGQLVH